MSHSSVLSVVADTLWERTDNRNIRPQQGLRGLGCRPFGGHINFLGIAFLQWDNNVDEDLAAKMGLQGLKGRVVPGKGHGENDDLVCRLDGLLIGEPYDEGGILWQFRHQFTADICGAGCIARAKRHRHTCGTGQSAMRGPVLVGRFPR